MEGGNTLWQKLSSCTKQSTRESLIISSISVVQILLPEVTIKHWKCWGIPKEKDSLLSELISIKSNPFIQEMVAKSKF